MALLLAYGLLCGGITALISVLSGSSVATLAFSVGMLLLTMRQYSGAWAEYMPANLVDQRALMSLTLTNIFGMRLNFFQSGFLLYIALTVILLVVCWLCWRQKTTNEK